MAAGIGRLSQLAIAGNATDRPINDLVDLSIRMLGNDSFESLLQLCSGRLGFTKRSAIGIRNRGFDPLAILLGKKDKLGDAGSYHTGGCKSEEYASTDNGGRVPQAPCETWLIPLVNNFVQPGVTQAVHPR